MQTMLALISEIYLPLPPECWDKRCMAFSDYTPLINLISRLYFHTLKMDAQRIRTYEFSSQVHGDTNQVHSSVCVCMCVCSLWDFYREKIREGNTTETRKTRRGAFMII